jgi:predicted RND superfamily exporter protein
MKTGAEGCRLYDSLRQMDDLAWALRQDPGVQTTTSLAESVRSVSSAMFEGSPKWLALSRNQAIVDASVSAAMIATPDITNQGCSVSPLVAYLADHKADTLSRVLKIAEDFKLQQTASGSTEQPVEFLLAAGSAGIEAATNIEVQKSIITMYLAVYGPRRCCA